MFVIVAVSHTDVVLCSESDQYDIKRVAIVKLHGVHNRHLAVFLIAITQHAASCPIVSHGPEESYRIPTIMHPD